MKAFEEKLGKPFYYYLFNMHRTNKVCPVCGTDWKIYSEKTFVDYKCEKCRLAADETSKYGQKQIANSDRGKTGLQKPFIKTSVGDWEVQLLNSKKIPNVISIGI